MVGMRGGHRISSYRRVAVSMLSWSRDGPRQALPKPDNSAAVALSRFDSADGQSVSVAASSIIMASRFLASSNGRLVISAILRSR